MDGAILVALLGTVLFGFAARQTHIRATASGAPMSTSLHLAILAGGFAIAIALVATIGLRWSLGQAVALSTFAVFLGLYLPQILGVVGSGLGHMAHGAARGVGAGLESALSWAMPKLLAVTAVVLTYMFVPQLFAIAVMIVGFMLIFNGVFGKKASKKKRSH